MAWFLPLLLATVLSTADKVISRHTLRVICNPDVYLLVYQLICLILSIPAAALSLPDSFPFLLAPRAEILKLFLLMLATMVAWSVFGIATFRSAATLELSISAIFSRSKFLWTTLLGISFFGESLTILHAIGLFFIFISTVSLRSAPVQLINLKGITYTLLSAISISAAMALDKCLLAWFPVPIVLFIGYLGSTLTGLALNKRHKNKTAEQGNLPRTVMKKIYCKATLAGLAGSSGYYFLLIAMQHGSLSVVIPLFQSSYILVVLAGVFF